MAKTTAEGKKKSAAALDRRNRLATVLAKEAASGRAAARFVFRHHPALVREAASTYERRARSARKRASTNEQGPMPRAAGRAPRTPIAL